MNLHASVLRRLLRQRDRNDKYVISEVRFSFSRPENPARGPKSGFKVMSGVIFQAEQAQKAVNPVAEFYLVELFLYIISYSKSTT